MIFSAQFPLTRRLRLFALPVVLAWMILALTTGPAPAAAATPAPAFTVRSISSPTRLVPGDESRDSSFAVEVTNSGAETTGGPVTITDELPAGVVLAPDKLGAPIPELGITAQTGTLNKYGSCVQGPPPSCTSSEVLRPGQSLIMQVPVNVEPGAEGIALNRATVTAAGAAPVSIAEGAPFSAEPAPFGFSALGTATAGPDGADFTQAGGHPYRFTTALEFNQFLFEGHSTPSGSPHEVVVHLPRGFVVDPEATPVRCTEAELESLGPGGSGSLCPEASAVGVVRPVIGTFGTALPFRSEPIYNMVPPHGAAASLAFDPDNLHINIHLLGSVNSAGEYELTATARNIPQYGEFSGVEVELWGDPSDESHAYVRGNCFRFLDEPCPVEPVATPLLTMPTSCQGVAPTTAFSASSWQERERFLTGSAPLKGPAGEPFTLDGCNRLEFAPTISARPTTNHADSPTGLEFDLHQPQNEDKESLATANLKDARVTLPAGLTVNPSAANGLDACSAQQIGLTTAIGDAQAHFTEEPQTCPNGAKLGTLEVSTPLLEHKLPGAIYLARPSQNPFGSLLAIYLAVEDEETGVIAKLAGKVEPDPTTGRLTATFAENPELPLEDVELHFFEGDAAPLKTSIACGMYTTTSRLTPWSTPEGADATPSSTFQTSVAASGSGPCPSSEAGAPDMPSFSAGTVSPLAGAYSPFTLRLARADGTQQITGIDTTLPAGLTGKLAGIPYCPEGDIVQARSREAPEQGRVEQAGPSCPAASEVGTVTVGAGAGNQPYYVTGHAYLAGPYKGAPISLVIVTPAVAGPFDLGTVVTRVALFVDTSTAQIHAVSDPLPTILQGIPLDVRSIALRLDRPGFTLNPTSCEASAITGTVSSPSGATASVGNRFQVGNCSALPFKPKLTVHLKGATGRTGHPGLKAVVTTNPGEAGIRRAQVNLPHQEFLDQGNLNNVCTRPVLLEGRCAKSSVYGKAKAWTPLLEKPLEGNVYLVGGYGYKLPALVAELNGQIRILLAGKVDSGPNKGIRNTFEVVPDAPVSRFVLEMKGGKKYGLLENSEPLCTTPKARRRAIVRFVGQNGKAEQFKPVVTNQCGKGKGNGHR